MGCTELASGCPWRAHPTAASAVPSQLCRALCQLDDAAVCTPCLSHVLAPRLCFTLPWAVVASPPGTGCPCYWQISLSLVPGKSAFRLCLGMLLQSHLLQMIPPGCFAGTSCPPIQAGWVAAGLSPDHVEMPLFAMG